jgi:uncharacterized membrane protein YhaH (DUF805 family)
MNWFRYCMRHYAEFSGRAGRAEYWWMCWVTFAIVFLLGLPGIVSPVFDWLSWLAAAALLIPNLAVTARRLHDIGRSLWVFGVWCLAFAPAVAAALYVNVHEEDPMALAGLGLLASFYFLAVLVWALWLTYLLCRRGDAGPNRYGEPAPLTPG